MDYKNIYNTLIIKAQNRSILKSEYKEHHHIIPESIGGKNISKNMVYLFPEEHLIAHLLLVKIHPENSKLIYAANMMTNGSGNKNQKRVNKSKNKQYKWLKEKFIKLQKIRLSGNNNHNYGKKMSDETKRKISESKKGVSSKVKGVPLSLEVRLKMSLSKKKLYENGYVSKSIGYKHSEKSKNSMSTNSRGKNIGVDNGMFGKTHSDKVKIILKEKQLKLWRITNISTGLIWEGKDITLFCLENNLVKGSLQDVARARKKNPNFNYTYRKVWVCELIED